MNIFKLPDLGEGLQDAEIVAWHVSLGDHVVQDQPLVSVETAKAVVEIPSPQSGTVTKIFAEQGDVVEIGTNLIEFDGETAMDKGAIVGELPTSNKPSPATPAIRRLAKELGVDLSSTKGTGPGDSVTAEDVQREAKISRENVTVERLTGVRRAMAKSMSEAGAQVVPATVTDAAVIEHWPDDADITIRLAQAIVKGVQTEPGLNAWYYPNRRERWIFEDINLGLAIDTKDGLFAPVLRNVGSRTAEDLRIGLQKLRRDVEVRGIPPEELRGQTISLSNFGMISGQYAALVIVPPQVAILGAGRISSRVKINGNQAIEQRILPLSLTFDHRVVTGGEAARFLAAVMESLEGNETSREQA